MPYHFDPVSDNVPIFHCYRTSGSVDNVRGYYTEALSTQYKMLHGFGITTSAQLTTTKPPSLVADFTSLPSMMILQVIVPESDKF